MTLINWFGQLCNLRKTVSQKSDIDISCGVFASAANKPAGHVQNRKEEEPPAWGATAASAETGRALFWAGCLKAAVDECHLLCRHAFVQAELFVKDCRM